MSSDRPQFTDEGYEFALCLTHDVDRPVKTLGHALYYALADRDPSHVTDWLGDDDPYWQFEEVMALEDELGVRSSFYFLVERRLGELPRSKLTDVQTLIQRIGRYDVTWPAITDVVRRLDRGGWEVGLHGSYHTATDPDRLAFEKRRIESVLGDRIVGGRQHYLRAEVPTTWRHYADMGLRYDTSLGSCSEYGFHNGYDPLRPFDDEFVVFPLTLMEQALPDPGTEFAAARDACDALLREAAANDAVMTALWHPRYFCDEDFPNYRRLYRYVVERALERNAWVGSPGEFYEAYLAPEANPSATENRV